MFTMLLPSRMVTSSREVDETSSRTATAEGFLDSSTSFSISSSRRRSRAVSLLENTAESTRQTSRMLR